MSEDPRGRGYPGLAKPSTRVTGAYRGVWHALLVETPRNLRKIQTVRRGLKALNRR